MKFQAMYEQKDPLQLKALCERSRMGLLLTRDGERRTQAGWTNAAWAGERGFVVHLALDDPQAKALVQGGEAGLCFSEILSTIPNYWVEQDNASRATNLYLHAEYACAVQVLDRGPEALKALESLMRAYQPEGGYRDLAAHAEYYAPKAAPLKVAYLRVKVVRSKWKLGQVWPLPLWTEILGKLKQRGRPEDLRSAAEIETWMRAHPAAAAPTN